MLPNAVLSLRCQITRVDMRHYNVASSKYVAALADVPRADVSSLRDKVLDYLSKRDERSWYRDPIRTVIKGKSFTNGNNVNTISASNVINGNQILATYEELNYVVSHMENYAPPSADLRHQVRLLEDHILNAHADLLVGNQLLDFGKQDGITEIEEALEANVVERRLNDDLLSDEREGRVVISRKPAFVGCVSNFSNFLDLCRKVCRNIELGIPVVIFSRSNTTQHMFR
eukprot:TRINITY_DN827_c0_g1_i1.p1 TRINITY_DN827_c0_g1~~TRINITY_DN827_c0_g1_i1.p1  ORF type:complete len:229 (+),score=31.97 TRINITY_DN827_c0_g1_i1:140-826(+)